MASHELIDAQFDRAVEIVQGLPKTGPIQTDYEEKLTMYSLFKQATVGNVKSPRPGIWDMLGRAKWDAWAKQKDLDPYEAKQLYVEALLKVLSKYSDKTIARSLVEELESFGGDAGHSVLSRSSTKYAGSGASGSTVSDTSAAGPKAGNPGPHNRDADDEQDELTSTSGEEESEDEAHELPPMNTSRVPLENRPPSSLSSQRYRTPLAGSLAMSPPPSRGIPSQQPLPGFATPSAFAESVSGAQANAPPSSYHPYPHPESVHSYRGNSRNQMRGYPSQYESVPATALERAVESVQVHLAALTERLETLESRSLLASRSAVPGVSPQGPGPSSWLTSSGSPNGRNGTPQWDIDDLGMWSIVLNPLSRGIDGLKELSTFFARNENRSPSMIIVRRLCLDVSFLLSVIVVIGALWRKSGVRRREVRAALVILWGAIIGSKPHRHRVQPHSV